VVNISTICVGFGHARKRAAIKPLPMKRIDAGAYGL
jgi:hypothetical protein